MKPRLSIYLIMFLMCWYFIILFEKLFNFFLKKRINEYVEYVINEELKEEENNELLS